VVLLFIVPLVKSLCDGQSWHLCRRVSCRVRSALISLLYRKTLTADLTALKEGTGWLNNLMSVDTNEISEFSSHTSMLWSAVYEAAIAFGLLFLLLGPASIGGVVLIIVSVPMFKEATKLLRGYQSKLLQNKVSALQCLNVLYDYYSFQHLRLLFIKCTKTLKYS
jgi:ATP-binding cassette subfamily C (CFTR/MRP) protein 3